MRRCAQRVEILSENARIKNHGDYYIDEHILVCLSSSPSSTKIIRTAARMAKAFKGRFTALVVETADLSTMDDKNKERLYANLRLAEQLGAQVEIQFVEKMFLFKLRSLREYLECLNLLLDEVQQLDHTFSRNQH